MIAAKNEYLAEASETMLQSYHDACVRTYCEAVEEARRCRRGLEIRLERAEAQLQEKDEELQATKNALHHELQTKNEEIAQLKALLDATSKESK